MYVRMYICIYVVCVLLLVMMKSSRYSMHAVCVYNFKLHQQCAAADMRTARAQPTMCTKRKQKVCAGE